MTMAMATSWFLQFLLILTISTSVVATNKSPLASAPPSSSATSFLRASCASVQQLADACYSLLLRYADSFHGSVARVATLAVARQHNLTDELARLKLRGTGAGSIPDMALVSCCDTVAGNDDGSNVTLGRLDDLVAGVKNREGFESERLFAQNWFDTSASDMIQCVDWIHGAGDAAMSSPVLKQVIAGCTTVAPYMEIAGGLTSSIKFQSL